jgi:hypothetical protein
MLQSLSGTKDQEGTRLVKMLQAIAPAAILGELSIGPRHRVRVRQRATTQAV